MREGHTIVTLLTAGCLVTVLVHDSCTDSFTLALAECVSLRLYGGTDSERDGRVCGRGAVAAAVAVSRGVMECGWLLSDLFCARSRGGCSYES